MNLHQAARKGDLATVQALLQGGPDLAATQGKLQSTALHEAVQGGDAAVVEALLVAGAPVNAQDGEGCTPLFRAAGRLDLIQILLRHGGDPRIPRTSGWRPAFSAAADGHVDILAALVAAGEDLSAVGQGFSALHVAAHFNQPAIIDWLLDRGVSVGLCAGEDRTALHVAAARGHLAAASALVARGAPLDVLDRGGKTPAQVIAGRSAKKLRALLAPGEAVSGPPPLRLLREAIPRGDLAAVRAAIQAGADIHAGIDQALVFSRTPLCAAVETGNTAIVAALLEAGADINEVGPRGGRPLRLACRRRDEALIGWMLASGARWDITDKDGEHPFADLYEKEHLGILAFVFAQGADINARHQFGQTLLTRARDPEVVAFLIAQGADVDARSNDARTPLHDAAIYNRTEKARLLLAAGAAPDPVSQYGETPLHEAAERNSLDVIPLLLAAGASLTRETPRGKTPLVLAEEYGHALAIDLLRPGAASAAVVVVDPEKQAQLWALLGRSSPPEELEALLAAPGVDISARNAEQDTPLHVAVKADRPAHVAVLLAAGADLNALDQGSEPPIFAAFRRDDPQIAMMLLAGGYDVRAVTTQGMTVLHQAARSRQLPVVREILRRGAALDGRNRWGRTPLLEALEQRSSPAAELLIKKGSPLVAQVGGEGRTPLLLALEKCSLPVLRALLARGVDVNERPAGVKGIAAEAPLHLALSKDNLAAAELLLKAGVDVGLPDQDGWPALHYLASRAGTAKALTWLLDHGADVGQRGVLGRTALHWASLSRDAEENLRLLLHRGADLEQTDDDGATALHMAAQDDKLDALRVLLAAGANHSAQDRRGRTPLMATLSWRVQEGCARALLQAGADASIPDREGETVQRRAVAAGAAGLLALLEAAGSASR